MALQEYRPVFLYVKWFFTSFVVVLDTLLGCQFEDAITFASEESPGQVCQYLSPQVGRPAGLL